MLPLGKPPRFESIVSMGMAGLLLATNWLNYVKYLPIQPFLGIAGLVGGWVPMLMSLPFWLYQPSNIKLNWIGKGVLVTTTVLVLAMVIPISPTQQFRDRVDWAKFNSVIPSYGSPNKLTSERVTGGSVETVVAYLETNQIFRYPISYRILLGLGGLNVIIFVNKLRKIKTLEKSKIILAVLITSMAIIGGKVWFSDLLPLLIMIGLIGTWSEDWSGKYGLIMSSILWIAMLTINPQVCLWVLTPIWLIFDYKKIALAWAVAVVLNPLMIGAWL